MTMSCKFFLAASIVPLIATLFSVAQIRFVSPLLEPQELLPTIHSNKTHNQRPEILPIPGVSGPEGFASDRDGGGPYTAVSDGRIIKWQGNKSRWINFAVTTPNSTAKSSTSRPHPIALVLTEFSIFPATATWAARLPIPGALGPESLAFDRSGGGPYTGVSDGRIIRWDATQDRWINFAVTTPLRSGCEGPHDHVQTEARCGRPLGLSFKRQTGQLYIADAYKGLLVVGPNGGVAKPVATQAEGVPFKFTNDVVVDQITGIVYFTDSSTRFQRKDYQEVISTGDNTGRLLRYDPRTNAATVLLGGLMFPNGVALSKNGDFLLVTETTNARVLRYWLISGKTELFTTLPGNPDNIRRNQNGEFWVAMNSRGNPGYSGLGMAARLDQYGRIVEVIQDRSGATWKYASEVDEVHGTLWVGSVVESAVVKLRLYYVRIWGK